MFHNAAKVTKSQAEMGHSFSQNALLNKKTFVHAGFSATC
jgi:hypothetical protein